MNRCKSRFASSLSFALLAIALVMKSGLAQTSHTLSGVVIDQSGGAIVSAAVTLRVGQRVLASAMTDSTGHFVLGEVPEGQYQIEVEKVQFDRVRMAFVVGAIPTSPFRIELKVASVSQKVDVVRGVAEDLPYAVDRANTATKTDTPILETPFSVEVVPHQILDDQQAIRLSDATRNVSGVQTNFGYGSLYEAFALRGFETNVTLRDGERASGGIGRSSVDLANVEDVEVLKGPAAMLYGRLEPGGMINVITKKPLVAPHYSLQQQFGSYNLFRTTLDATGPILQDGSLLYRAIYSYFSADQFMVHALHGQTQFAAPSVTWRPNQKLSMNLNVEYRNNDPLTANGTAAIGNRPADIPISTYLGGDIGDWANVRRKVIDFNSSYQINSGWGLHGAANVTFDDIDFQEFFGGSLDETPGPTFGDYTNVPWFDKRRSKGGNAALDLTGHLRTRGMRHTLLIGTDYYQLDYADRGFVNGWNPVDTMNIFHPVYGRSTAYGAHAALAATPPDWTSVGNLAWNGLYVQDQVQILENLHLLIGGRYDWARATSGSITLEYASPGATLNDVEKTTAREQKFSPQVGLLYQALPWLGVYGNYVNSLGTWGTSNVVATDINGRPLRAQRSSSYEGGAKLNALNGRINSTISAFNITKNHVATRDLSSADPNALRDVGEARSYGVEIDTTGQLTARISVLATYAFTKAKFTKDNSGLQGLWIANVPRNSGSAWLRGELIRDRLSAGAGVFLRGQRQGDNENTFQLPGYVTIDAYIASHFRWKGSRITPQVNFTNLLDKRYFLNTNVYDASPRLGIMPGQPFSVTGSIRWDY